MQHPLLAIVFIFAILTACTTNTVDPVGYDSSAVSSSRRQSSSIGSSSSLSSSGISPSSSSGINGSSSSFVGLPDAENAVIAGPNDLKVSSVVRNKTMVLTWTDIALKKDEYSGYKIYRSANFLRWDSVGVAPPEQQFFRDNSLDSNEYKYMYRIIAYKTKPGGGDTLISRWSNQAGVLAVNELGFGNVVFDAPSNLSIVRWAPSVWELFWTHSGRKPELGFVVQRMGLITEHEDVFKNPGDSLRPASLRSATANPILKTDEAFWYDQDTLSETNNHLYVDSAHAWGLYRVFAYYNDEFGRMISEFTDEVQTPLAYHPSIKFTPPALYPQIRDSSHVDFTWIPTHDLSISGAYVKQLYWHVRVNVAGAIRDTIFNNDNAGFLQVPVPFYDLCRVVVTVNLVWIDVFDYTDVVWSVGGSAAGVDGNLRDKAKLCKE